MNVNEARDIGHEQAKGDNVMKKFKLYWLDSTEEEVTGHDIADAFTHSGYGAGALSALDYYREIK